MLRLQARILIPLLMFAFSAMSHAAYSPGELFVKLSEPPTRSSLDGTLETTSASLNALFELGQVTATIPFAVFASRFESAEKILKIDAGDNMDSLFEVFSSDPAIEWVSKNNHYSAFSSLDEGYTPNDSLFLNAWWLPIIKAPLAWELTRGDTNIIIGIIDTGIDYLHPDLSPNIWRNRAEVDSNGVDDDGNGFVDDVVGWDFVDAPAFPAAGDYLQRDNNPMDEFGHGTYVAGIAASASDNELCYPSIGFHCRVMCLRAGNSSGLLEEDDIAAALLYGAANGASVINMSFGDNVASPLLREAVIIAHDAEVVLVSSAGNSASQSIHYPSGFPEVISVGASNEIDRRADFSNYGPSVDLVAPGVNIVSTIMGGECGEWTYPQGTSYAAPMVAATAALMLSVNSSLTPDDVLEIVSTTADDVFVPGWDSQTAHGRLNVRRAVEQAAYGSDVVARITSPSNDYGVAEDFAIMGEAWGAAFDSFSVRYGLGENPQEWIFAASGMERHYGDSLTWIEIPDEDTVLVVRLEVFGAGGIHSIDHIHLYVQTLLPSIDSLVIRRMLDRDSYGDMIQVYANQVTTASMLLTNLSGDSIREDFGYLTSEHVGLLSQQNYPGTWQVRVRVENLTGADACSDSFTFEIDPPPLTQNAFELTATTLPHGGLGPFTSDFDCDDRPEVWYVPASDGTITDDLRPMEWNGEDFETSSPGGSPTYGFHISKAFGDADGDGLFEMMAIRNPETRIWEQSSPCGELNQVVFETPNFLGGAFLDLDSTDGQREILGLTPLPGGDDRYIVYSVGSGYSVTAQDTLPNETEGSNLLGPPFAVVRDLDADGKLNIVYGDYDGDIIVCEYESNHFVQKWSTRLPINDATSWAAAGDFDGDGVIELVAGCASNIRGGTESQRRSRHWEYYVFEPDGNDGFTESDSIFILGQELAGDYPSSITAADVDADGRDDMLISAYPDFYIVSYDDLSGRYLPSWYYLPAQSSQTLVVDWNNNGINEFFFSNGEYFQRVEAVSGGSNRPRPPLQVMGEPNSEASVAIHWNEVSGAEEYRIYRAGQAPNFLLIEIVSDTLVVLNSVPEGQPFIYAVTAVDSAFPQAESVFSNYITLTANSAPTSKDTASFVEPNIVKVVFSEAMGPSAERQGSYQLDDGRMPAVIVSGEGGRAFYLSFDGEFQEGWYELSLRNLRDAQGSELPHNESDVVFEVVRIAHNPPRIVSHHLQGGAIANQVEIEFSREMSSSVLSSDNYHLDFGRPNTPTRAESVSSLETDNRLVRVALPPEYPVGATGFSVRLQLRNIESQDSVAMDTTAGMADIVFGSAATNLSEAYVFPNPYRGIGAGGESGVNFAGLPSSAIIRIFAVNGVLLREIEHEGEGGAARWDLRNEKGDAVAGGIYLYTIESGGEEKRGKFAILR